MTASYRLLPIGALLLPALTGCSSFYDTTPKTGFTKTVFDARLPDAMDEYMGACHDEINLDDAAQVLTPLGDCTSFSGLSSDAQLVALGVTVNGDVAVPAVFDATTESSLHVSTTLVDPIPWPYQNCDIDVDTTGLSFVGLSLTDFDASWRTRSGEPSLSFDFDPIPGEVVIDGDIDLSADCPVLANEWVLNGYLPNGFHEVSVDGLDVDVYFRITVVSGQAVVTVESDVNATGLTVSPAFSSQFVNNVGEVEDLLADHAGFDLQTTLAAAEGNVDAGFASIAPSVEAMINDAIPSGESICSVNVTTQGKLRVKSSVSGTCP